MAQAYRAEGDKRLRNETDSKRVESDGKIQLLRKAKKRYETLAKFGGAVEDDEGDFARPLTYIATSDVRPFARRKTKRSVAQTNLW